MKKLESEQRLLNIAERFARYGIGKELPPKEEVEEMKKEAILFLISDVFWGRTGPYGSFTKEVGEAIKAHQDFLFWMTTFICNTVGFSSYKKICEAISLEPNPKLDSILGAKVLCPIIIKLSILNGKVFTKQDKKEELYAASIVDLEANLIYSDLDRRYCKYNLNRFEVKKLSEDLINEKVKCCCQDVYSIFDWRDSIQEDEINLNLLDLLRNLISISLTQQLVEGWVGAKKSGRTKCTPH